MRTRSIDAALTPDGRHCLTAGRPGFVRIWDIRLGKPVGPPIATDASQRKMDAYSVEITPDGLRAVVGTESGARRHRPGRPPCRGWLRTRANSRRLAELSTGYRVDAGSLARLTEDESARPLARASGRRLPPRSGRRRRGPKSAPRRDAGPRSSSLASSSPTRGTGPEPRPPSPGSSGIIPATWRSCGGSATSRRITRAGRGRRHLRPRLIQLGLGGSLGRLRVRRPAAGGERGRSLPQALSMDPRPLPSDRQCDGGPALGKACLLAALTGPDQDEVIRWALASADESIRQREPSRRPT